MDAYYTFVSKINSLKDGEDYTIFHIISSLPSNILSDVFGEMYPSIKSTHIEDILEDLLLEDLSEDEQGPFHIFDFVAGIISDDPEQINKLVPYLLKIDDSRIGRLGADFNTRILLHMKNKSLENKVLEKALPYLLKPTRHFLRNIKVGIKGSENAKTELIKSFTRDNL